MNIYIQYYNNYYIKLLEFIEYIKAVKRFLININSWLVLNNKLLIN